jgi:hypothetical protein
MRVNALDRPRWYSVAPLSIRALISLRQSRLAQAVEHGRKIGACSFIHLTVIGGGRQRSCPCR